MALPTTSAPPSSPSPETPSTTSSGMELPQFGVKVMLIGDSGTGKTQSICSLIKAGITPFVIATEQNFVQVAKPFGLGTALHYKYISPQPGKQFSNIADMLKKVNTLSYENLTKVSDPFKQAHNTMLDVVAAMNDFTCDCCKKSWGSVENWQTDRALVIDSMSGLTEMAFGLVVGNKPARSMPDYGIAQQAIKMLLGPICTQLPCHFVLACHISREKDEITGGTTITVSTVGNKLGPDLPRMFSDVIRTRREGAKFSWDTADSQATVVARHVGIASAIDPSFVPLINKWKANGGKIIATT